MMYVMENRERANGVQYAICTQMKGSETALKNRTQRVQSENYNGLICKTPLSIYRRANIKMNRKNVC